jgi:hypothetical protein
MSSTGLSCVVESPSLLHRRVGPSPAVVSSNPAVFVRPSSAHFQRQEALRKRVSQWQAPEPLTSVLQRPTSAEEGEKCSGTRPVTANTTSGRTSVRSSSAASSGRLQRQQQAILAARNQQALTDSVESWEHTGSRAASRGSRELREPPFLHRSQPSPSPTAGTTTSAKLRKAPKSLIDAVAQRLRDSHYDSPCRQQPVPSEAPASSAAAVQRHAISSICCARYGNALSEQIKATRPFTFEHQHHDQVQEEAAELRLLVAASASRTLQTRKFRACKVKEAKEFWRTHPMPSTVDINKLLPDRGNNLRSALRSVRASRRNEDEEPA